MPNISPNHPYQDYVFKSGKFVGHFEEMYRDSVDVPWHQDETAHAIFSDMCVTIIRHCQPASLLDVGCGLGYMAERFRREVPGLSNVVGMDISATAAAEAAKMFPAVRFLAGEMKSVRLDETFDVVVSKDVLWYVVDDLGGYINALAARSNKWIYIGQSFPETRPYYGETQLPNAEALFHTLEKSGLELSYQLVERDARYGNREYAHALLKTRQSGSSPLV
jgi:SAM-dependent methyltransferase